MSKENKIIQWPDLDMVRISTAKQRVGVCSNTLRGYSQKGLRLYRVGRATFFSIRELEQFIRTVSSMAK